MIQYHLNISDHCHGFSIALANLSRVILIQEGLIAKSYGHLENPLMFGTSLTLQSEINMSRTVVLTVVQSIAYIFLSEPGLSAIDCLYQTDLHHLTFETLLCRPCGICVSPRCLNPVMSIVCEVNTHISLEVCQDRLVSALIQHRYCHVKHSLINVISGIIEV
jgi:hypothetical protein